MTRSERTEMPPKLFTPTDANRMLPLVRSIVADILEKAGELRGRTALARNPELDPDVRQLRQDVLDLMHEIEELGASYKDWDFQVGLVDFPGQVEGEDVFFCWRSDETSIEFYHPRETGFSGRRRIPSHLFDEDA